MKSFPDAISLQQGNHRLMAKPWRSSKKCGIMAKWIRTSWMQFNPYSVISPGSSFGGHCLVDLRTGESGINANVLMYYNGVIQFAVAGEQGYHEEGTELSLNTFHHVVAIVNGNNNTLQVYVNNILEFEDSIIPHFSTSFDYFLAGNNFRTQIFYWFRNRNILYDVIYRGKL